MDTIVNLFGLPALIVAVVIVERIVTRVATPSAAGRPIRRADGRRSSGQDGPLLPSLAELVLDPQNRYFPTNVWYDIDTSHRFHDSIDDT